MIVISIIYLTDGKNHTLIRSVLPRGAVLVRPDGHVAFRAPAAVAGPRAALNAALDWTLQRR